MNQDRALAGEYSKWHQLAIRAFCNPAVFCIGYAIVLGDDGVERMKKIRPFYQFDTVIVTFCSTISLWLTQ